ncbi:hypothetical protein ACFL04_02900 [Patescibacteria group bacterium]
MSANTETSELKRIGHLTENLPTQLREMGTAKVSLVDVPRRGEKVIVEITTTKHLPLKSIRKVAAAVADQDFSLATVRGKKVVFHHYLFPESEKG